MPLRGFNRRRGGRGGGIADKLVRNFPQRQKSARIGHQQKKAGVITPKFTYEGGRGGWRRTSFAPVPLPSRPGLPEIVAPFSSSPFPCYLPSVYLRVTLLRGQSNLHKTHHHHRHNDQHYPQTCRTIVMPQFPPTPWDIASRRDQKAPAPASAAPIAAPVAAAGAVSVHHNPPLVTPTPRPPSPQTGPRSFFLSSLLLALRASPASPVPTRRATRSTVSTRRTPAANQARTPPDLRTSEDVSFRFVSFREQSTQTHSHAQAHAHT